MGVSSHSAARADHSVKRSLFMNSGTKVRAGPIDKKRTPINISMDRGGCPFLGAFWGVLFGCPFLFAFSALFPKIMMLICRWQGSVCLVAQNIDFLI